MEQEDYIKRQIDQLGRVLGKILSDLAGMKTSGQVSECVQAADHALKEALGLDISQLTLMPAEGIIETLQVERNVSDDNLNNLADIFFYLPAILSRQLPILTKG